MLENRTMIHSGFLRTRWSRMWNFIAILVMLPSTIIQLPFCHAWIPLNINGFPLTLSSTSSTSSLSLSSSSSSLSSSTTTTRNGRSKRIASMPTTMIPAKERETTNDANRRTFLQQSATQLLLLGSVLTTAHPSIPSTIAEARTPGSKDVTASIQQIVDAKASLQQLEKDFDSVYAIIDDEGRAKSTDAARRILGGIAPQAGAVAIDVAKNTPLYRIDVAFVSIRQAVLQSPTTPTASATATGAADESWTDKLDLDRFEELADRLIYETQKADGNFYSVLFAMKGTTMIQDIFRETKSLVQQGIADLDEMIQLLKVAGAPVVLE